MTKWHKLCHNYYGCSNRTNYLGELTKESVNLVLKYHRTPLVQWLLHKYKCLCGVGGKGWSASLHKGISHTYTLKLGFSKISILY